MACELTQQLSVNGVELAWDSWGTPSDKPTFVLCHGFSGSAHDFALHVEPLAIDRRVVALDLRGHGRSTKTGDPATYTIDLLTADLVAFIEATCDAPVDLLGHSMGGRIAIGLAVERPDLLHSLIAMDTSAWSFVRPGSEIATLMGAFFAGFDPAAGLPKLDLPSPETALIEAGTPKDWRDRKEELSAGFDPYALKALGTALFTNDVPAVRDRLHTIGVPVTVIAGANDHPFSDQAPELAAAVADGRTAIIDGAYHSPQLSHPEEWRGVVRGHLDSVTDRSSARSRARHA